MLAADPHAGAFYICNPNNPTGTVTGRQDIEFLLSNKPKGAIVIVDEAYIHLSENLPSAKEFVLAGKRRIRPAWPTKVRVTIGTREDMNAFKAAVDKIWS